MTVSTRPGVSRLKRLMEAAGGTLQRGGFRVGSSCGLTDGGQRVHRIRAQGAAMTEPAMFDFIVAHACRW
jgi:hypothetical protein